MSVRSTRKYLWSRKYLSSLTSLTCVGILLTSCAAQAGGAWTQEPDGPATQSVTALSTSEPASAQPSTRDQQIPPGWTGKIISSVPTSRQVVALTIDCGANRAGVSSILTTLRAANVPATFFVTGQFARTYPKAVRDMVAGGHLVANHSDTHPHLPQLSAKAQTAQLRKAQRSITSAAGTSPRPWFRFPFGSYNSASVRLVNREGYAAIGWTVDSLGWLGTSKGQSAKSVEKRVLAAATPGEIPLMHCGSNPDDGSTLDADAMPAIIRGLSERGYTFATLGDLSR